MRKRWLCLLVAAVVLAGMSFELMAGFVAQETTREVNQNDPFAPYQTITAAVQDALPGDVIVVHPGVYEESVVISGITLRALRGPEVTVLQSPDGTGDGVLATGNQNVALIGFRVQGFERGIVVDTNGGSARVANCIATANSDNGFHLGDSVPISTKIVNNISADNGGNGIYTDKSGATFTSIFNNIVFRNGLYGFAIGRYGSRTFGDYNCVFANSVESASPGWVDGGQHTIQTDPLIDARTHYRFTSQSSPAVNAGHPSSFYDDPDGSANDMGAFGGPEAGNWWRDPFAGPTVENVTVDPPQTSPGGFITIRATARTE